MLFDTHRDMLQAETVADQLTEDLEAEADAVALVLDKVAEYAEAISNGSSEDANQAVTQASVSILSLLLAREARSKKVEELISNFEASSNDVLNSVNAAVTQLRSNAQTLSATAEQSNTQSAAVAAGSEEADVNVQTVAAATEQLSGSIVEITQQMDHSAQITRAASEEAELTTETVRNLSTASQKIGDVVSLITDIAEQTNLLALNATIEAARGRCRKRLCRCCLRGEVTG